MHETVLHLNQHSQPARRRQPSRLSAGSSASAALMNKEALFTHLIVFCGRSALDCPMASGMIEFGFNNLTALTRPMSEPRRNQDNRPAVASLIADLRPLKCCGAERLRQPGALLPRLCNIPTCHTVSTRTHTHRHTIVDLYTCTAPTPTSYEFISQT